MAEQYARGLWGRFAPDESPFAAANGMEDNLRLIDDHLGLYTLQPPVSPTAPEPANPSPGDGQIFTDGGYSVFNGGEWRAYPPRKGIRAVLVAGTESWLNTGATWAAFSVVDTAPAVAAAQEAIAPLLAEVEAAAETVQASLSAALMAGNVRANVAAALGATPIGQGAWIEPNATDGFTAFTYIKVTGPGSWTLITRLPDGSAYSVIASAIAQAVLQSLDGLGMFRIDAAGEVFTTRLEGRSVQEVLLELSQLVAALASEPNVWSILAPYAAAGVQKVRMAYFQADGLLMLPHTGGVPLQDYVRTAVEAIVKSKGAGSALSFVQGDVTTFMFREDGNLHLPRLGDRSVQDCLLSHDQSIALLDRKLGTDPPTLRIGDKSVASLIRDPADPLYASGRMYVAIPSIAKAGGRLWVAFTANRNTSVNSGEEPGSFCVVVYSEDNGVTWQQGMFIAHPNPANGRTADPTLVVRSDGLHLYYFQSGKGPYDEAISTWHIFCANPGAHPLRTVWSSPVRVAYGYFVTSQYRYDGCEVMPLVVLPDNLASAGVIEVQHPNIERGTTLYKALGHSMTPIGRIPFDLPVSSRSWAETSVQPCPDGSLLALIRYSDGLYFQRSFDGGKTWGGKALITTAAGIDATVSAKGSLTTTDSGRLCLVWNNSAVATRTSITIALSSDSGATWPVKKLLDSKDKISYPSVAHDGDAIHVVWDFDRMAVKRIYHTVLSEAALIAGTQVVTIHAVNGD